MDSEDVITGPIYCNNFLDYGLDCSQNFGGTIISEHCPASCGECPSITITSPSGGEEWQMGSTQTISWTSENLSNDGVAFSLLDNGNFIDVIDYFEPANGSYSWTIPTGLNPGSAFTIWMEESQNPPVFTQSAAFTLTSAASITVTTPNGGETYYHGQAATIEWVKDGVDLVDIHLYKADNQIAILSENNSGTSLTWYPYFSYYTGDNYTIRVSDASQVDDVYDSSDANFSIAAPSIIITAPTGADNLILGETIDIEWTSYGVDNVDIFLYSGFSYNNQYYPDIANNVSSSNGSNSISWTIPSDLDTSEPWTIHVMAWGGSPGWYSDYLWLSEPPSITGCMDDGACNYDNMATEDDDSCDYSCIGCIDADACNYDSDFTVACNDCCAYPEEHYDCYGAFCQGEGEELDCAGECNGEAELSACGCNEPAPDENQCCANGLSPDGESLDCAGVCGGDAVYDNCGYLCIVNTPSADCSIYCDADPSNDCIQDCAGEWGGYAIEETYYFDSDGDGLGSGEASIYCDALVSDGWVTNNNDLEPDCFSNDTDECGICGGDNSSCSDCMGTPYGTAELDCADICGGSFVIDECGICDGDGSTCEPFFGTAGIALEIQNVRNYYGDALDDSDFSCSNSSYNIQSACEAVGVCSDAVYTTQYICEGASSCSISDYTTQATCEDGGTCSNPDYTTLSECASNGSCSDVQYTTPSTCQNAGGSWTYETWYSAYWTEVTWTQTNTWTASGTLDIHMILQEGCAYCDDPLYDNQLSCENNGNIGAGGTWSFDASIDSETCSGVCTNSLGDVSQYQNYYACQWITQSSDRGLCSDLSIITQLNCVNAGEIWVQNTWITSDMNGKYVIGNISGFTFQIFGITVTGASGGLAEDYGFSIITQEESFAANGDVLPNVMGVSFQGTTIPAGAGVLTEISFTDLEQEGICFTSTPGTCDTPPDDFVDIFGDQYGECIASIDWGDCACYGDLVEDCAGVCGGSGEYDCREGNDEYPQTESALYGYCDGSEDYEAVEEDCAGVCNGPGGYLSDGTTCCATGAIGCDDECDSGAILSVCGCDEPTIDTNGCCANGLSPDGEEQDCQGVCGGNDVLSSSSIAIITMDSAEFGMLQTQYTFDGDPYYDNWDQVWKRAVSQIIITSDSGAVYILDRPLNYTSSSGSTPPPFHFEQSTDNESRNRDEWIIRSYGSYANINAWGEVGGFFYADYWNYSVMDWDLNSNWDIDDMQTEFFPNGCCDQDDVWLGNCCSGASLIMTAGWAEGEICDCGGEGNVYDCAGICGDYSDGSCHPDNIDCADECCGDAIVDECGVCDGELNTELDIISLDFSSPGNGDYGPMFYGVDLYITDPSVVDFETNFDFEIYRFDIRNENGTFTQWAPASDSGVPHPEPRECNQSNTIRDWGDASYYSSGDLSLSIWESDWYLDICCSYSMNDWNNTPTSFIFDDIHVDYQSYSYSSNSNHIHSPGVGNLINSWEEGAVCDCEGNIFDCSGDCGGDIFYDDCGVCGGDNSPNTGFCDCFGVANGNAVYDECGICDNDPSNDCILDCNGIWGGTAIIDECGVCDAFYEEQPDYPYGNCDCAGVSNGNATEDICGECNGTSAYPYQCEMPVSSNLGMDLEIFPSGIFGLNDWLNGEIKLAELSLHNSGDSTIHYILYYYGYLNNEKVVDGFTYDQMINAGDSTFFSNTNFDPYSIEQYYQNIDFMYSLESLGYLYSGNYMVGVLAYESETGDLLASTYTGHILGCTDPEASNYYEGSTMNDGSCVFTQDIISIYDVPQDQGGYVFINWSANSLDSPNTMGLDNITSYSVWRYIPSNRGWEFLDYIDAYFFEEYAYTAPTIETSTVSDTLMTTYQVLAHTENQEIFYVSDPADGFSFDNLSPSVPNSVTAFAGYSNGIIVSLSWSEAIEQDFQYFSIFRDGELVSYATENTYTDGPSSQTNEVSYHLTATDIHGNESESSESLTVQLTVNQMMQTDMGWNWFSYNLGMEDNSVESILESLGDNGVFIASQSSGIASYYEGYGWNGSLVELDPTEMYKMKMGSPATLSITGYPLQVATTPISLIEGWNWIGYLPQNAGDLNIALETIGGDGIFIASQSSGIASYYEGYGWLGSLTTLEPGSGYFLKMAVPGTLIYPDFDGLARLNENKQEVILTETISDWDFNFRDYEYIGTITSSIESREDSDGDIVGVFVDDECRGIAERMYFPLDDSYYYIIQVYSNIVEGEKMTFKYYDQINDEVIEYTETIEFSDNMMVGDGLNTMPLSREFIIPVEFSLKSAYPNPFNPVTTLEFGLPVDGNVSIDVYNIQGRLIETLEKRPLEAGYHSVVWNADAHASGVYFVKMVAGEYIKTQKLMLMK